MKEPAAEGRLSPLAMLIPISILALAFLIRFHHVGRLPVGNDEAVWATYAMDRPICLDEMLELFGVPVVSLASLLGVPSPLHLCLAAPAEAPLDAFMAYFRFRSAGAGALTVLFVYILAAKLYSRRAAVFSSLLLCFLPWHILQSRIVIMAVWAPYYGCLIFLCLTKAMEVRRPWAAALWLVLSGYFLHRAMHMYGSAFLFVGIYGAVLLWCGVGLKSSPRFKVGFAGFGLLVLAAVILRIVVNVIRFNLWGLYWDRVFPDYQGNLFRGDLLLNIINNLGGNFATAFDYLFFWRRSSMFFAEGAWPPGLTDPTALLLTVASIVVVLLTVVSFVYSLLRRNQADRILLTWLVLGVLGAMAGVTFFQPRYVILVLPPLMIFMGKCFEEIRGHFGGEVPSGAKVITVLEAACCLSLIVTGGIQWTRFDRGWHTQPESCRHYRCGTREAGRFLAHLPDITDHCVFANREIPVDFYVNFFLLRSGRTDRYGRIQSDEGSGEAGCAYHVLWLPIENSRDVAEGAIREAYDRFTEEHPGLEPIKRIDYPTGQEAIRIYRVETIPEEGAGTTGESASPGSGP